MHSPIRKCKERTGKLEIRIAQGLSGCHRYKISMRPEEFEYELPLSHRFQSDINIEVAIEKLDKELKIGMQVQTQLTTTCDRCLAMVKKNIQGTYERVFIFGSLDDNRESEKKDIRFTLDKEVRVYLEEDIRETLLLAVPFKVLCEKEGCRVPLFSKNQKLALSSWQLAWRDIEVENNNKRRNKENLN